ncbi:homoserine dehydrogenase [Pseudanabaena sp. PCC 6802]|uniref:homoserine dehydrogenase n=1 Tax=Pseudanabaena sp. PCC 6802 TaxID=118173 RepID=UPI000344B299|nr:homoserine dehydrogenase [Pseudanabaena sp. PCC 6802]
MSCKIGILGLGTVGTGVAKILLDPEGRHPVLREIEIKSVGVRSLSTKRDVDLPASYYTNNLESIVNDPDIEIIVELIGGLEPARSLILQAIANGKHVVTANKAVLARYGAEIFTAAKANGVYVMLEASVGGGIPIIQALKQALGANRIAAVTGIINGTTNYILSRMHQEGGAFEDILANAQALGYAEADPTADVDGYDAADKIAILASLAFGDRIKLDEIYREGIRNVTSIDIHWATELGFAIKLLGIARHAVVDGESGLDIRVHPTLIPITHPLASINGVTNAVTVAGDPIGEVVFSGPGAGSGATASAVVADIINVVAALKSGTGKINQLMGCSHQHYAKVHSVDSNKTQFYVRLIARDRPGVIGEIGMRFGKHLVNLESIIQKNSHGEFAEVVVVTKQVVERNFQTAIADIKNLDAIESIATVLRIL